MHYFGCRAAPRDGVEDHQINRPAIGVRRLQHDGGRRLERAAALGLERSIERDAIKQNRIVLSSHSVWSMILSEKSATFRDHALALLRHNFVGCAKSRCEAWRRAQPRRDFAHAIGREPRGCTPYTAFVTQ